MAGDALDWEFNPWRERTFRTLASVAVVAGLVVLLTFALGLSPFSTLISAIVLTMAILPGIVPVYYRVDEEGVDIGLPLFTSHYAWGDIEKVSVDKHAVQIRTEGSSVTGKRIHEMFHPDPESLLDELEELAGDKLVTGTLYDREGERMTGKSIEEREEEEIIPPKDKDQTESKTTAG